MFLSVEVHSASGESQSTYEEDPHRVNPNLGHSAPDAFQVDKGLMDQSLRGRQGILHHTDGIGALLCRRCRIEAGFDLDVRRSDHLRILNTVDGFYGDDRDRELADDILSARGRFLSADRELRVTDLGAVGLDDRTYTVIDVVGGESVVYRGNRCPILEDQILESGHFAYLESDLISANALARWLEENGLLKYGNGAAELTVKRLNPK